MHQLLQTQLHGASSITQSKHDSQNSVQINEIISLSSFEIVKNLKIPVPIYVMLVTIEICYMILTPAQKMFLEQPKVTILLFENITAFYIYLTSIGITMIMLMQMVYIILRGRNLKYQQSSGNETGGVQEGSLVYYLNKFSGIFLTTFSTALSQLFMRMIIENFSCDKKYELDYGCDSKLRNITQYFSYASIVLIFIMNAFSDIFLTKLFPNDQIPWSSWNEQSRQYRNYYKALQVLALSLIPPSYEVFINGGLIFIAYNIISNRYEIPQVYNRFVHVSMVVLECQLFTFSFFAFLVAILNFKLTGIGLVYISIIGIFLAILMIYKIDMNEQEILSVSSDIKNFESIAEVELFLVVMLHELERLTQSEEYAHQKHIHAIVGRHMEECQDESCPCKNYEPEYDKKFTTMQFSRRFTNQFSIGFSSGSSAAQKSQNSIVDLKRLPYKINYKTKLEIFKKEFQDRVDSFLEEHPKSCGIKLLKSFFNHKYCDSSYKALFVQLENSITSKEFKDKVFIYHLKTQIQDEMKKSTESPLSIDIHSLLRYEKFKLDFEKNLEDLSSDCQSFWTDLTKDDFKVENALQVAYKVAGKIITIKKLFTKIIEINPLCIDTSSIYALIYRHMLRDEATFNELVNKIQQIKNSSKLEYQREIGIRFFDSDIYALLMASGEIKELGRIKQANSSSRFVFGYDPKELIGSKINKLMPGPFAQIHDKFLLRFLSQGNSDWLDRNQPLAVLTKDGFLQMTLFYIKPMVSLEFGLIFSCFARKLNQYNMADDSSELIKMHKLCTLLTDSDGFIHCMSDSCSKRLGIPPPSVGSQLSINDNQMFNISQLCPQLLQQDYEFELVKGVKMMVTTTFLKKERQYRREFPEIACKINEYQAEIGIHKFIYRDLKQEINIFVLKLADKDEYENNNAYYSDGSKSGGEEELTYSEFSVTTANSSVLSSQMATSKFKTFKSKIQQMESSTQINYFSKISWFTFILLLGIATGNFAINLIENQKFIKNLDVLTNLQILQQQVLDSAHSTRQLVLITNGLVKQNDEIINDYNAIYQNKYSFYSDALQQASQLFENIQNHLQTILKSLIQLDSYRISVKDVKTDGDIQNMPQSIQTSLNLFSSKILKVSSYRRGSIGIPSNTIIPKISFDWKDQFLQNSTVNEIQQDLYFIIENGLGSIQEGIHTVLNEKQKNTVQSSEQAGTVSIVLAAVSIVLVLILIPISFKPMTQIELVSELILMSLIKLPENFCINESKGCSEITMFLSEQKEGEKSTHGMIKKHDHRKNNKQLLKLPKANKTQGLFQQESMFSSNLDSEGSSEAGILINHKETTSIDSNGAGKSSRITQLSKVKAQNGINQSQRIQRNEQGTIDLDLSLAKTSEIQDDFYNDDDQFIKSGKEPTEEERIQNEREIRRKEDIVSSFKKYRIRKFLWLIVTAIIISIYYAITCFYLSLIHNYERVYLENYSLIGRKIQCYTNQVSFLIDSLARNSNMSTDKIQNANWYYLEDCFKQEQDYKQMLIEGQSSILDTFNSLNDKLNKDQICKVLSTFKNSDTLMIRKINYQKCLQVYNGILTNGGLSETLFHFLRSQQEVLLLFEDRNAKTNQLKDIEVIKRLLKMNETNELISLNQIYLKSAFEYLRSEALQIVQNYFTKLNNYYNLLFGLFVSLLSVFQIIVSAILVKKLTLQIVKIYHVVLLIPLSGRTQNDLNELMIIQM